MYVKLSEHQQYSFIYIFSDTVFFICYSLPSDQILFWMWFLLVLFFNLILLLKSHRNHINWHENILFLSPLYFFPKHPWIKRKCHSPPRPPASFAVFHSKELECSAEAELCSCIVVRELLPWKTRLLSLTGSQNKIEQIL